MTAAPQLPPDAIRLASTRTDTRPEGTTSPSTRTATATTDLSSAGDKHGTDQTTPDALSTGVGAAERSPAPSKYVAAPKHAAPGVVDPILILAAQALDDLEATRIANENRVRALRDVYGLAGSNQEAEAQGLVDGLAALEHGAELSLKRALRRHPLGPWVKRTVGVGEKQGARLLAAIGDPYWNTLHDRPRTVSELWAYCGLHVIRTAHWAGENNPAAGVAPTRHRGHKANWNADAKSRTWLVAVSCIKQAASPYRAVYDDGRTKYADAVHHAPCRRCGLSGHPADVGTPLSAGHQHARALRLVSKAILRDLWRESRALHNEDEENATDG